MYRLVFSIVLFIVILASCTKPRNNYDVVIPSPNGQLHLHFNLHNGEPYYLVYLDDDIVVGWSLLGFVNDGSETLQENMLAMQVGPLKNDDEISQLASGEKYNSLKVHLQKQGDSEMGYDVVFLIYDEAIIYWYEYNPELENLVTNLKENTEFDLHVKNQEWSLIDTVQMSDTLLLPVSFKSDLGIDLKFLEMNSSRILVSYLLQREENIPEFYIKTLPKENDSQLENQESKIKTNKKSIHISRNN